MNRLRTFLNSMYNSLNGNGSCCLSQKSNNTNINNTNINNTNINHTNINHTNINHTNMNLNRENIPSKSYGTSSKKIKDVDVYYHVPNWKDTIPFVPPITEGVIIKVYDGDTITLATSLYIKTRLPKNPTPNIDIDQEYQHLDYEVYSDVEFKTYRMTIRLAGIDTPEIKGKTEKEKQLAKQAQEALEKLLLNKVVQLKNIKTEKYGRILADVYLDDTHVNEWMINNNYAVKYDGKTKCYDWNNHNI